MMPAIVDLQWFARRALRRLGLPGVAALAALAAALVLAFAGLLPLLDDIAGLRAELSRPAVAVVAPNSIPDAGEQLARDLEDFSARFPTIVQLSGQLDALFDLAAAQGLSVNRGEYALVEKSGGQWRRFELTLPVTGTYPQVRALVSEMLAKMPALAISDIALEREKIADGQLRATLRLVVFVSKGA